MGYTQNSQGDQDTQFPIANDCLGRDDHPCKTQEFNVALGTQDKEKAALQNAGHRTAKTHAVHKPPQFEYDLRAPQGRVSLLGESKNC